MTVHEEVDQAKTIFKRTYGRQGNFMTPNLIRYGLIAPYMAYELSSGEGINGGQLYGVTVLRSKFGKPIEKMRQISQAFGTLAEAEAHINNLIKEQQNEL